MNQPRTGVRLRPTHIRTTPRLAKPGMHSENACVWQMLARCDQPAKQSIQHDLSAFQSPGRQTKIPYSHRPPAFQGHAVHCMNPEQPWQILAAYIEHGWGGAGRFIHFTLVEGISRKIWEMGLEWSSQMGSSLKTIN